MERLVLIVDDAPNVLDVLAVALTSLPGIKVQTVQSAAEALGILQRGLRGGAKVSALVTDLNMPHIDGFELIAHLRGDAAFRGLPILVISADTRVTTPQRVKQLGADAFFPKPYSPMAVCRTLQQLLYARQSPGS